MFAVADKTLAELGWDRILERLSDLCRSSVGKTQAAQLPFLEAPDEISAQFLRVAEARRLTAESLEIPVADTPDVADFLLRASRAAVLEPGELLACARLIRTATRVRRFLSARRASIPVLAAESDALSEFDPLAAEVERAIDPAGGLSDDASSELSALRARVRGLHARIRTRIDEILHDPGLDEILRDKYYSVRGERYVLPVKASYRSKVPGVVHNASQSGQTLFIEPTELLDMGEQLTIARALVDDEEQRILTDLSDAIGRRAVELRADLDRLAELDRLNAIARLSDLLGGVEPRRTDPSEPFDFPALRHPLLVLRGIGVVPNDVRLEPGRRALVISGPNAGGKTVTMSAVGLCVLMTRAGLPLPTVSAARVPLFTDIRSAINDDSDLQRDLSTFTAHLAALQRIDEGTNHGTLVLIDEIASGTDPREGAAIAIALIERFLDRGAQLIVTTHLEEVKARSLTDARCLAAAVTFDFERMAPTYRLELYRVGTSSAIEVAQRVGLAAEVCDRARELLGGAGGALSRVISQLDRERADVRRLEQVLEKERQGLERARLEWERQRVALEAARAEAEAHVRRQLLPELEAVRAEVRGFVTRLQQGGTVREAVQAQRAVETQIEKQTKESARAQARAKADKQAERVDELQPGMRVQVVSLRQEGKVLAIEGDSVTVAVGPMRIRVEKPDVVGLRGPAVDTTRIKATPAERLAKAEQARAGTVPTGIERLDLRGMRVEQALSRVREALDRLALADGSEVHILHGHGTGLLKRAVRDELASSPYVQTWRPADAAEGGDAVSIARLRGS